MGDFGDKIRAFAARNEAELDEIVVKTVLELRSRLILRSPVGNPDLWKHPRTGYVGGNFRNHWRYACDVPPAGLEPDSSGGKPDTPAPGPTFPLNPSRHTHYVFNALPYAWALERGHSTQAPLGMVGIVALEFPDIVRAAAASVRR
jgi:hypothetical protein